MNHIYKVLWSVSQNCWIVVSEFGKGRKKSKSLKLAVTSLALTLSSPLAFAMSGNCDTAGKTCTLSPTWSPNANNNQVGAATIDDGQYYDLKTPLGFTISTAPAYYGSITSIDQLKGGNYLVNSGEVLPGDNAIEMKLGQTKNVLVKDPVTGNNYTVTVYDSGKITTQKSNLIDVGAVTVLKNGAIEPTYVDTSFARVSNGAVDINISTHDLTFGVMKTSDIVYVDGTKNTANAVWSSSNRFNIYNSKSYGRDDKSKFDTRETTYSGTFSAYDGSTHTVNNLIDFQNYNNFLIKQVEAGKITKNQYDTEFGKAYNTVSSSHEFYYIPRKSDGVMPVDGWQYVTPDNQNSAMRAIGANASIEIGRNAVIEHSYGVAAKDNQNDNNEALIKLEQGAKGYNLGTIYSTNGHDLVTRDNSVFTNYGSMNPGYDLNATKPLQSSVLYIGASLFDSSQFINATGASYNISPFAYYDDSVRNMNVLATGIWGQGKSSIINHGTINVAVNDGNRYGKQSSVTGVKLTDEATFTNESDGIINVAQDKDGNSLQNSIGTMAVKVMSSNASFINKGLIQLSEATNGAMGVNVTKGNVTNNGTIELNGDGKDSTGNKYIAGTNYGVKASGVASNVVNTGNININGSNNIGLYAENSALITLDGGLINVNGGVNEKGLANYAVEVDNSTVVYNQGKIQLNGDKAIGIVARNGGKIDLAGSGEMEFGTGSGQIGYLLNGVNSSLINTSTSTQDVTSGNSILIRLDNGASLSGKGSTSSTYTASGKGSTVILASGKSTSVDATGMELNAVGEDSIAARIEGGATAIFQDKTKINLSGEGSIAAVVDGNGTNIMGEETGIIEGTKLESSAVLSSNLAGVTGYRVNNNALLTNNGNIHFTNKNTTAVEVNSGSTGINNGDITLDGAGSIGLKSYALSSDRATTLTNSGNITLNGNWDGSNNDTRARGVDASGKNVQVNIGDDAGVSQSKIMLNGDGAVGVKASDQSQVALKGNTALTFSNTASDQIGFWVDGAGSHIQLNPGNEKITANGNGSTVFYVTDGASLAGDINLDMNLSSGGTDGKLTKGIHVSGKEALAALGNNSHVLLGDNTAAIFADNYGKATIENNTTFTIQGTNAVVGTVVDNGEIINQAFINSEIGSSNATAFDVQENGILSNTGEVDLSEGTMHTAIKLHNGTVNNSGDIIADGIALDITGQKSVIQNTGTIEAIDGTAAIRIGSGASLNLASVVGSATGRGILNANGTADGILLDTGAVGLNVDDTILNLGGQSSQWGINNQAGIDITLNNTDINAKADGNGILMTGGHLTKGAKDSTINVNNGIGIAYQATDGSSVNMDIDQTKGAGNLNINVSGTGTGIQAKLSNRNTVILNSQVNILSDSGGNAANISGANTISNQGSLVSKSEKQAVLDVNDAVTITNTGKIQALDVNHVAIAMANGIDHEFVNQGNITGSLDFKDGNNTLNLEDGTIDGTINAQGGSNTLISKGGVHTGQINLTGSHNQSVTVAQAGTIGDVTVGTGTNDITVAGTIGRFIGQDAGKNTVSIDGQTAKFTSLDSGKGSNNTLILNNHDYELTRNNQNSLQHFDLLNLTSGTTLTLKEQLLMTQNNTTTAGSINLASGTNLTFDGLATSNHALLGTGDINVLDNINQFSFGNGTGSSFAGNVNMNATSFELSGDNTDALTQANLVLQSSNNTHVGKGLQNIGGLEFDNGRLAFDVERIGSKDLVSGKIKTGILDVSKTGSVQLNVPDDLKIDVDVDTTVHLLDQQNNVLANLIKADEVKGSAADITLVDKNGDAITDTQYHQISQDDDVVAVGSYDYRTTTGEKNDGLYVGFGLTQLDLQQDKTLNMSTANSIEKNMSAKVTGTGNFSVLAGNGANALTISNGKNDYTGTTTVQTGTVNLGGNNTLGQTRELSLAKGTTVNLTDGNGDYKQAVGILNTEDTSTLNLAKQGELTVNNGGNVVGQLIGNGTLIINGNQAGNALSINSDNSALNGNVVVNTDGKLMIKHINALGDSTLALADGLATLSGVQGLFTNDLSGKGQLATETNSNVTLANNNQQFTGTLSTAKQSSMTVTEQKNIGGTTSINNSGQFIVNNNTHDITLNAVVDGTGNLVKTGSETLTLAKDNTFTGTLDIQKGIVAINKESNLGAKSSQTLLNGGDLLIASDLVSNRHVTLAQPGGKVLVDDGVTASLSGWQYQNSNLNNIDGPDFTKGGNGTLILTGDNSQAQGGVHVAGGTLQISELNNIGSSIGRVLIDDQSVLLMEQQNAGDVNFSRELAGNGTFRVDLASTQSQFDFASTAQNGGQFKGDLDILNGQFRFNEISDDVLKNGTLKLSADGNKTGSAHLSGDHTIGGLTMNGGTLSVDYKPGGLHLDGQLTVTEQLDVSGGGKVKITSPDNLPIPVGDLNSSESFFDQLPTILDYVVLNESGKETIGIGSQLELIDGDNNAIGQTVSVERKENNERVGDSIYDYSAFVENKGIGIGYGLTELRADNEKHIYVTNKNATTGNNVLGAKLSGQGGFRFNTPDTIYIGNANSNYTGTTEVTGGTVIANTDNAFGKTSALNVNDAGATVDFNGNKQTVGQLNISQGGQVILSTHAQSHKISDLIVTNGGHVSGENALVGNGHLQVTGDNLVIDDNNAFTGKTTIGENGTITLTKAPQGLGNSHINIAGKLKLQGTEGSLMNTLSGKGDVNLTDKGNILLNANNQDFNGRFNVESGTLTAMEKNNVGESSINIDKDGKFVLNNVEDNFWEFKNKTQGTGTLAKEGLGIVLVNDNNVSVDHVEVNNGTLILGEGISNKDNAVLTAKTFDINKHGTVAGYGTVKGDMSNTGSLFVGGAFANLSHQPMSKDSSAYGKFTIDGNYVGADGDIYFTGDLNSDHNSPVDQLVITGDAKGKSNVSVYNIGGQGDKTLEEGILLIDVGGTSSQDAFALKGRAVAGAYEYSLYKGDGKGGYDNNWYLRSDEKVIRPEPGGYINNLAMANTLFDNRLHDRQGGFIYVDPITGEQYHSSMWIRNVDGRNRWNTSDGQVKSDTNRYVVQLGGELANTEIGDGHGHLGLMAGYGRTSGNSKSGVTGYKSKSEMNGYGVGLYGTWIQNTDDQTGAYIDTWMQYNWFDNTVKGSELGDEKYKSRGVTASVETGYAIQINETQGSKGQTNRWFVQPQAQVIYHGVTADDHTERNGTKITGSGEHNIQTRLGMKTFGLGHNDLDEGKGREFKPFVEVNWIHNTKDYGVVMDGQKVEQAGARDVGELKVGLEGQLNKDLEAWGNFAVQSGSHNYTDTQVVFGVKYRF